MIGGVVKPYYEDGTCTIYHGDCREVIADLGAEVVITDPPYGIAYSTAPSDAWDVKGAPAWRGQQIVGDDSTRLRDEVLEALRFPAAVFGSWKTDKPNGTRAVLVWDKGPERGMGDLTLPWKPSWEPIYILGPGWRGSRDEAVLKGYGLTTWVKGGRCHPNEKPVDLLRHLILKAPPGVVLDPFMGSGSTLRAAKDLGRRSIGIEIEERYCEVAVKRLAQEVLLLGQAGDPHL